MTSQYGGMRSRATLGVRWRLADSIVRFGVTIATAAILARLLTPEDFTLIAATLVVLNLLGMITDIGVAPSIIQRRDLSSEAISTFFWAAAAMAGTVVCLTWVSADHLAAAFGQPAAAEFISVAGAAVGAQSLRAHARALLLRSLRFRAISAVEMAAALVYVCVAVGLAAGTSAGPWSVVFAKLSETVFSTVALFVAARWVPSIVFRFSELRSGLAFNVAFFFGTSGNYVLKNVDYWVIGRTMGQSALGLYYIAYTLPNVIRQRVSWVVQEIFFSICSRLQDDIEATRRAYLRTARLAGFVMFPVLLGIAITSHELTIVMFGERWVAAAPAMRILAFAALIGTLNPLAQSVFAAQSSMRWNILAQVAQFAALAGGMILAVDIGTMTAVAWAVTGATSVRLGVDLALLRHVARIPVGDLMAAFRPLVVPLTVLYLTTTQAAQLLRGYPIPVIVSLALLAVLGTSTYFLTGALVSRSAFADAAKEAFAILVGRVRRPAPLTPITSGA